MKTALLIIDVQNDYFEGGRCVLAEPQKALSNVEHVLKLFRERKMPIIHIQHIDTAGLISWFQPGSRGAEIHERVKPLESEYHFAKNEPNCFFQTPLENILRQEQVTHLVVCGMMTQVCVDTTVQAARYTGPGLQITLLSDACATKELAFDERTVSAPDVQAAYMAALNGRFANVIKASELAGMMLPS